MKIKFLVRLPWFIKIPLFLFSAMVALVVIILVREPYENDSMPIVLTREEVKQSRLEDYPDNKSFREGAPCNDEKIEGYILAFLSDDETIINVECKMFGFGGGMLYFLDFSYYVAGESRILIKTWDRLREVVVLLGQYPGNHISDIRGNGESVVFKFSGWNNPEKVVELKPRFY